MRARASVQGLGLPGVFRIHIRAFDGMPQAIPKSGWQKAQLAYWALIAVVLLVIVLSRFV